MLQCHHWITNSCTKAFDSLTMNSLRVTAKTLNAVCKNNMINDVVKVYTKLVIASRSNTMKRDWKRNESIHMRRMTVWNLRTSLNEHPDATREKMRASHFGRRTLNCKAGRNECFALRSTNTKMQGRTEWVLRASLNEHPGAMEMARTSLTDFKINFGILESCWHSQLYTISFNNATALHKL